MFCKYCGRELPDNAKFCSKCGKQLVSEIHEETGVVKEQSKTKIVEVPEKNENQKQSTKAQEEYTEILNETIKPLKSELSARQELSLEFNKNIAMHKQNDKSITIFIILSFVLFGIGFLVTYYAFREWVAELATFSLIFFNIPAVAIYFISLKKLKTNIGINILFSVFLLIGIILLFAGAYEGGHTKLLFTGKYYKSDGDSFFEKGIIFSAVSMIAFIIIAILRKVKRLVHRIIVLEMVICLFLVLMTTQAFLNLNNCQKEASKAQYRVETFNVFEYLDMTSQGYDVKNERELKADANEAWNNVEFAQADRDRYCILLIICFISLIVTVIASGISEKRKNLKIVNINSLSEHQTKRSE